MGETDKNIPVCTIVNQAERFVQHQRRTTKGSKRKLDHDQIYSQPR